MIANISSPSIRMCYYICKQIDLSLCPTPDTCQAKMSKSHHSTRQRRSRVVATICGKIASCPTAKTNNRCADVCLRDMFFWYANHHIRAAESRKICVNSISKTYFMFEWEVSEWAECWKTSHHGKNTYEHTHNSHKRTSPLPPCENTQFTHQIIY